MSGCNTRVQRAISRRNPAVKGHLLELLERLSFAAAQETQARVRVAQAPLSIGLPGVDVQRLLQLLYRLRQQIAHSKKRRQRQRKKRLSFNTLQGVRGGDSPAGVPTAKLLLMPVGAAAKHRRIDRRHQRNHQQVLALLWGQWQNMEAVYAVSSGNSKSERL